jgi:HEAT repeat protein
VILAACCLLAASTAFMLRHREKEPSYEGKTLSQLMELSDPQNGSRDKSQRKLAAEGIRHIGTNAIPYFLTWIQYDEPGWVTKLRDSTDDRRTGKSIVPVKMLFRANLATRAFRSLGEDADYAIGDLVRLMNRGDSGEVPSRATWALAFMGRPGALPPLMAVITNLHSPVRLDAVSGMQEMGSNAQPAVPLLIECLKDKDEMVAKEAAWSLGELQLEPNIVVPALISNADPSRPIPYSFVLFALGEFGTNARSAVPLLMQAFRSGDEKVRSAATHALENIDPNLLTNTPPD